MRRIFAVAFFAVLLSSALAFAQNEDEVAAAEAACGPRRVNFDVKDDDAHHTISQPEAGKALVYVIQDIGAMQCYGACITSKIGVDGAWVGANHRNSYFSFALDPGEHHLCANWQSHLGRLSSVVGLTHLTAEAGKIYYYRTRAVGMGGPTFFDFEAIDSDQARLFIAQIPQSISNPKK